MERVLRFNAEHDFLTKLPNRSSFFHQAKVLLIISSSHPAEEKPAAWPLIDIDFFKQINDEHGHLAGDAVLEVSFRQPADAGGAQPGSGGEVRREEFIMLLRGRPWRPMPSWNASGNWSSSTASPISANDRRHHQPGPDPTPDELSPHG